MNRSVSLAISPCPNDTYAFETLLERWHITPHFYDIDTLNKLTLEKTFPLIKASAAVFRHVQDDYTYCTSGAAFSSRGGPIVIAKNPNIDLRRDLHKLHVATPGYTTSAFTTFCHLYGMPEKATQVIYSDIPRAVALDPDVDVGILIHEARTTYAVHFPGKLHHLADIHFDYNALTGHPIPLGLILVKKDLPNRTKELFQQALYESIQTALSRKDVVSPFILSHASDLSIDAILHHIQLYVTEDTLLMSDCAEKALKYFLSLQLG